MPSPWRYLQPSKRRSAGPWRSPGGGGARVDPVETYAWMLRKCDSLVQGKQIHAQIVVSGHGRTMFLGTLLIDMYGRCGSLGDAKAVFDHSVPERNVFAWNSLLTAYLDNARPREVLSMFRDMDAQGVEPNRLTFIRVLGACSCLRDPAEGKRLHFKLVSSGLTLQAGLGTALLDMYGKCGCLAEASLVFETMEDRTLVTWNAMLTAFAQQGHLEEAIRLYRRMNVEGFAADVFTLASVLSACDVAQGREVHARIVAAGLESHLVVGTALVRMYGRWGMVDEALAAFHRVAAKDVVCWTALITVLVEHCRFKRALKVYMDMLEEVEGEEADAQDGDHPRRRRRVEPDQFTFSSVLGACCSPEDLGMGRQIHLHIVDLGYDRDVVVATALVNMYARCRSLVEAKSMFDKVQRKNLITWNAMLLAYAESGDDRSVVELYKKMDLEPDAVVLSRVLVACANLGDVQTGKQIHRLVESREDLRSQLSLQNALVTLYSRCGKLVEARLVFDTVAGKDTISWNAMISASSQYNDADMSLELSREMQLDGVEPNEITFMSILHACAHAGLLKEARDYFHRIEPGLLVPEHFHCIIDLFGRLGRMSEAEDLIWCMPFEPDVVAWTTLIGSSKVHGRFDCAARASQYLSRLKPHESGPYVLFSNACNQDLDFEVEAACF